MRGSISKQTLPSGHIRWRYQIDAGEDEDGKRIRRGKSGYRREKDAAAAMREAMAELQRGIIQTPQTLREYLERWLPYHAQAGSLSPATAERYVSLMAHATAALGDVPLRDLTTFMLDDLYLKLGEKLSAKTVREVHSVLHVALKRAVKTKLLAHNPADGADLPRVDQREAVALNPRQLAGLEQAASGTPLDLFIRLAGATGARRGELLGLKWSDLDWRTGKLRIERSVYQVKDGIGFKPTKTRQARVVTIPPSLVEYLKVHRGQQQQNRRMFGPDYRSDLDLVFARPDGDFLRPDSVSWTVRDIAIRAGLEGVSLHSLRHTHASALLAAGVPIANVSRRLGHRDAHTTAKIYQHALPDSDEDVARTWDALREKAAASENGLAQNGTTREGQKPVTH